MEIYDYDFSDKLVDDEMIFAYLTEIMKENNSALLIAALGDIAKAKGMTEIAQKAGLSRASLYRALSADSAPRFDTICKVLNALGLSLVPARKLQENIEIHA